MKQEIAAVPASRFGLHLSDEAHPAARGYVRDDLTREGALRVPELPRGWHFAPEAYDGIAGWWNWGGAEPLLITGPAGSGKTASVLAFCAVMQMPAVVFTARPRMDRRELIGRWVLGPNGMTWVDGPAALAWRNGWVLLINEFSAAPPEVWVSANDLLEGLPLEIDQTGEVIDRHPLARIVFTDNTRGHSTELTAGYFGRQIQDRSVIDRMWHLRCEGLHEADEARVRQRAQGARRLNHLWGLKTAPLRSLFALPADSRNSRCVMRLGICRSRPTPLPLRQIPLSAMRSTVRCAMRSLRISKRSSASESRN
ncbi:AAA family ATPase [Sutterella wadsworthensis]|uniref:AAA family ATPase n=1 Tax=Sutterella wadsworthensis TaxID=40545 RepID=UPI002666F6E2|nr:AAA family ATPase [Sutterella wadsworthensis]